MLRFCLDVCVDVCTKFDWMSVFVDIESVIVQIC